MAIYSRSPVRKMDVYCCLLSTASFLLSLSLTAAEEGVSIRPYRMSLLNGHTIFPQLPKVEESRNSVVSTQIVPADPQLEADPRTSSNVGSYPTELGSNDDNIVPFLDSGPVPFDTLPSSPPAIEQSQLVLGETAWLNGLVNKDHTRTTGTPVNDVDERSAGDGWEVESEGYSEFARDDGIPSEYKRSTRRSHKPASYQSVVAAPVSYVAPQPSYARVVYVQPYPATGTISGSARANYPPPSYGYQPQPSYQQPAYQPISYSPPSYNSYPQPSYQPVYAPISYPAPVSSYNPPSYPQPSYQSPSSYSPPSYSPPAYSPPSYERSYPQPSYHPQPSYSQPSYHPPPSYEPSYSPPSYGQASYAETCPYVEGEYCYGKEPGHYAHPTNYECFVQCDHVGRAFAKSCAYGTKWRGKKEDGAAYGNMCS